jgi:pimeloyl-ACP methyl ester carboxylesterase
MNNKHQTIYLQVGNTKFAYRSFGNNSSIPLIFLQRFTGTMDDWDPLVTDDLAKDHQVILFNNTGVSSSSGITPDTVEDMAEDAIAFIESLSFSKVNLLGFSLGGFIAQQIAFKKPGLINKIILAGTGPRGSEGLDKMPETVGIAGQKEPIERMLYMFFNESENSKKAGIEFLNRTMKRTIERDPEVTLDTVMAQLNAIVGWGAIKNPEYPDQQNIIHPVLIVNGNNDRIVPTNNSYTLYKNLPNARLSLYPDSAHGALFQYPELFINEVSNFLKK